MAPLTPSRPKLVDEKFVMCHNEPQGIVCMTETDAQRILENKMKLGKYADHLENNLDFYRNLYAAKPRILIKTNRY